MPLTKKGKSSLKAFEKEYGITRGKGIFYAYIKKHPKKTNKWHLK